MQDHHYRCVVLPRISPDLLVGHRVPLPTSAHSPSPLTVAPTAKIAHSRPALGLSARLCVKAAPSLPNDTTSGSRSLHQKCSALCSAPLSLIDASPPSTHGIFLALHCFLLQQGPMPISIWVLLALIHGDRAMLIPEHVLFHMDPGAHTILVPWYTFDRDMPVPRASEASHPLRVFIIDHMDMQVRYRITRLARSYLNFLFQPSLIADVRSSGSAVAYSTGGIMSRCCHGGSADNTWLDRGDLPAVRQHETAALR
jgi:hypothetical protein